MIKDKAVFWIRVAGWTGLIAGAGTLELYKMTGNSTFLFTLGIVIVFSAYVLATATTPRWKNTKWIMKMMIFCLIFVSVIQTIFLWLAYRSVKKQTKV